MATKDQKEWHPYIVDFALLNDILVRSGNQPLDISKLQLTDYTLKTVATTRADALGHAITQYGEIYGIPAPRYVQEIIKPDSEDLKFIGIKHAVREMKYKSSTVEEISQAMQKWKEEMERRPRQPALFSIFLD